MLDFILALFALIILSPVIIVTALLVRLKLGSPVIFCQERPGYHEKIFKMLKFRTMSQERDEQGNLLPDEQRLTKFGCLLRASSLDELPELINIIKGDMSIVGPRPLAKIYLPYYYENERVRHNVRPGLTGLAQINGRNSISWEDKFAYDIKYVNNISFLMDLKIIMLTVGKVFSRSDIGQAEEAPVSLHILRANQKNKEDS
jgi:lipopolysaccharide/colanic/teichoic acid biosynthesis glycosyltransferase